MTAPEKYMMMRNKVIANYLEQYVKILAKGRVNSTSEFSARIRFFFLIKAARLREQREDPR